jgi:hypothetical protein
MPSGRGGRVLNSTNWLDTRVSEEKGSFSI